MSASPQLAPSDLPGCIAYYGGSFDPVHRGHLAIASALIERFDLDRFVFIPAYHAPHKIRSKPTSAYDRYAMLCLATRASSVMRVSKLEIELPDKPFTIDTLTRLSEQPEAQETYFVMGADSWMDITTWREWEKVLSISNHIVVTRPAVEIGFDHVTDDIRSRVRDRRSGSPSAPATDDAGPAIYITDAVNLDISATEIRHLIRSGEHQWKSDVPHAVAKYIEKYQIYK